MSTTTTHAILVCTHKAPEDLLAALTRCQSKLDYTDVNYLYDYIWVGDERFCGVFGDGPNGAYEWFVWRDDCKRLATSNKGYGSHAVALRDVLLREEPLRSDDNLEATQC